MGSWADEAARTIEEVHRRLPENTPLDERMKAIDAAYPFGERKYSPYKTWLAHRRKYLARYGYSPPSKKLIESPLERLMRRGRAKGGA